MINVIILVACTIVLLIGKEMDLESDTDPLFFDIFSRKIHTCYSGT